MVFYLLEAFSLAAVFAGEGGGGDLDLGWPYLLMLILVLVTHFLLARF